MADALGCEHCGCVIQDGDHWLIEGGALCGECWHEHETIHKREKEEAEREEEERYEAEARAFALEHCRITAEEDLEVYCASERFAPSPEDFQAGYREAHTPNSVFAHNRHNCTNYDELIKDLDKNSPKDRAYYDAIRERICELIGEPYDRYPF